MGRAVVLFRRFAWGVLGYTLLVVLWGAYVRASGSGAGCGSHWPLCNGEVIPRAQQVETLIEFTHRLTSGLSLLAVAALYVWAFRLFPRGSRVRRFAVLSVVFLLIEAALGAGLVLLRYVAQDASSGRAIYLSAHLVNTQILLAMLALTAWFATAQPSRNWLSDPISLTALAIALAVSVTGAIAALGDTLFPATSLAAGLRDELSGDSHALLRLRLLHPAAAIAGAAFLLWMALRAIRSDIGPAAKTAARWTALLVFLQLIAGAANVALLAPIWLQLTHLLIADLLWLALVLLAVSALQPADAKSAVTR
ncbi:MAG TPA: COX15/CtaA family protein [Bryobacteraceae bacterium]|nr:COX15/CtaA family protein [Bryobacteraceae bacterium]